MAKCPYSPSLARTPFVLRADAPNGHDGGDPAPRRGWRLRRTAALAGPDRLVGDRVRLAPSSAGPPWSATRGIMTDEAVAPVRVVLYGHTVREGGCLACTVRADGRLELHLADRETVTFGSDDWIDVRMLG